MWPSQAKQWEYLEAKVDCLLRSVQFLQGELAKVQATVISLNGSRYSTSSLQPRPTMRDRPVKRQR